PRNDDSSYQPPQTAYRSEPHSASGDVSLSKSCHHIIKFLGDRPDLIKIVYPEIIACSYETIANQGVSMKGDTVEQSDLKYNPVDDKDDIGKLMAIKLILRKYPQTIQTFYPDFVLALYPVMLTKASKAAQPYREDPDINPWDDEKNPISWSYASQV